MIDEQDILTVQQLTLMVKDILESEDSLQDVWVRGEISNFTLHSSGHLYFSIKDEFSQVSCVMFRKSVADLKFKPEHGKKVVLRGSTTVFVPRGNYQLLVTEMLEDGLGDLHKRFLELKERLGKEGLFDKKRLLPEFPKTIAVVTSPTGAAVRDIINTLKRRFPCVRVIIAPAVVQGEQGAQSIVKALHNVYKLENVDTLIVARGGGSLEDLWCFNEEVVARAIFESNIPVVCGVGHETDFTIADFVADVRAPTPSIAAELTVPNKEDLLYTVKTYKQQMVRALKNLVVFNKQLVDDYANRLIHKIRFVLQQKRARFDVLKSQLVALDPLAVLKRGFSVTLSKDKTINDSKQVKKDEEIVTILYKGKIRSKVVDHGI